MEPSPGIRLHRNRSYWTKRLVPVAIVLALLAAFVSQNYVLVEIRLLGMRRDIHLAWIVLLAMIAGMLVGYVLPRPPQIRNRR